MRTLLSMLGLLLAAGLAAAQGQDDRGRAIEAAAPPQRVVSLVPSLTEIVCALDACARLVGTDRYSSWPASVATLPKLGGLDDPQVERVLALKPDLVLISSSSRAAERFEQLGLRVVALQPRNLQDTERVITQVALALGDPAAGPRLWRQLQARIGAAAARVPAPLRGRSVYFEAASPSYAAGEASFIGEVLAQLGMANVVPASLGPFPKLNPEFVLRARPAIVMASARALEEMPGRPGWDRLPALQQRMGCGFGKEAWDTLVRPGPRLAEGAEHIADCLVALAARQP